LNLEKPTFDITHLKDITVKSGQNYEIHSPYRAYPLPRAEWTVDDKEINIDGQRIQANVPFIKSLSFKCYISF